MNPNYIIFAIPLFLLLILAEVIVELISKKGTYRFADSVSNMGIGIGEQVISVFTRVLMLMLFDYIYQHRLITLPANIFTGIVLLFAFDFIFYWAHRFGHEVNIGWGGHIVHHSSEEYNLTVALRQPWFFNLMTFALFLPLAYFGFSPLLLVIISGIDILFQFWIHTRFIPKLGPLEWVLNTPSHHRVHHGRNPKYLDKNYGGMFIIYDRMFGTFQEEEEEVVYGTTTPLNSWNPAWANVQYFVDLFHQAKPAKTLKDKINIFLKPPGWRPDYLGGMDYPKEVNNDNYHKFEFSYPAQLNPYVLFQFLVLIVATTYYLSVVGHSVLGWKSIVSAAYILFSVSIFGLLFEKRKPAFWAEFVRLLAFPALIVLLPLHFSWVIAAMLISGVSVLWLLYILMKYKL